MRGLSVDTDTLYAGKCVTNRISHFSVEDLRSVDLTPLNSPYLTEDTTLLDLKLTPSLFIVLFRECTYLVQSFSRDGNLSHLIVPHEQLNEARFFCLDRHLNIIVSDFETHDVNWIKIPSDQSDPIKRNRRYNMWYHRIPTTRTTTTRT